MSEYNIATIETVSMREQFEHEEHDFTPWLKNNIDRLSADKLLNINFNEVEKEKSVIDNKQVDIVARNTENDITAVIENQFEESDSDHLGRSLIYASDVDADIVVWIAEEFLERHKKTIQWLNSTSGDDISYFAIEVNLRKIDDSPYAVEFQSYERPADWEKKVQEKYLNEKQLRRLRFWQEFQQECNRLGIAGKSPNKSASHRISVFETTKRPAYIRPTIHYSSAPMNIIRFYEDSREIVRDEGKREILNNHIQESISELDTSLDSNITDSISIDIDDNNKFDKLIIMSNISNHNKLSNEEAVEEACRWMVDTTRVFHKTLHKLSEDEIEAEPV